MMEQFLKYTVKRTTKTFGQISQETQRKKAKTTSLATTKKKLYCVHKNFDFTNTQHTDIFTS